MSARRAATAIPAPPIDGDIHTLAYGMTEHGQAVHAARRCQVGPDNFTLSSLCPGPTLTRQVVNRPPTCRRCVRILAKLDQAAAEVMATGRPGGHPSQHDPGCRLSQPDRPPVLPGAGSPSCDRLPGCHWPETDVAVAVGGRGPGVHRRRAPVRGFVHVGEHVGKRVGERVGELDAERCLTSRRRSP